MAYEVEITADWAETSETHKGIVCYTATSSGDLLKLTFKGSLAESVKRKATSAGTTGFPSGPPLDMLMGPRRMRVARPIGGNILLTITPRGELRAIEGESSLPYLLGDLSMLVFEPLPENDQKSWSINNDIAVGQRDDSSDWPPRPSFLRGRESRKTTSGSESTTFAHQSDQGDLSVFQKTLQLKSGDDKESFALDGQGLWTFNRRLGVPESLDCKYTFAVKNANVSVSAPLTVKYRRLSDEEWAKHEKERTEKEQQLRAEHERRQAERESPLEGAERDKLLAELKSKDEQVVFKALGLLSLKEKAKPDKEVAEAIKPLLKHSNPVVRQLAGRAIAIYAPEIGQKLDLNEAYSGSMSVDQTGPMVTATTPLPRGLILAVKWTGSWHAAKVVRALSDGQVEVEVIGWHRTETHPRSELRLAPPEVDQPGISRAVLAKIYGRPVQNAENDDEGDDDAPDAADDSAAGSAKDKAADPNAMRGYRPWTDDSGTYAIVAKFVRADATHVTLQRKKDGKEVNVPLERLSTADRRIVEHLRNAPVPSNPFDP